MSFSVIAADPLEGKLKRLTQKYKSLKSDLASIIDLLALNPTLSTPIGKNYFKIRIAITIKDNGGVEANGKSRK